MRFITLTKVNSDRRGFSGRPQLMVIDSYSDNEEGEGVPSASVAPPVPQPVLVNAEAIRCFYPRKDNAPGTRLTFVDGGGFAVNEDFEAVKAMVNGPA